MALITKEQLQELKQEISYQIHRITKDLKMTRKSPPGMVKSKRRLIFLFHVLKELERDGRLDVVGDSHEFITIGGVEYDGASMDVDE